MRRWFNGGGLSRDNLIVGGALIMIGLFAFLVSWDGYTFYITVFKERKVDIGQRIMKPLRSSEIDEVIKLLDERNEKFDALLLR